MQLRLKITLVFAWSVLVRMEGESRKTDRWLQD